MVFRIIHHAHDLAAISVAAFVTPPPRCSFASRRRRALPSTETARHLIHMTC